MKKADFANLLQGVRELKAARRLATLTPAEMLREEFLGPMELTPYRLAKDIERRQPATPPRSPKWRSRPCALPDRPPRVEPSVTSAGSATREVCRRRNVAIA